MAAIGLYGVMSYSIGAATSEIGIRMALGASGRSVIGMVLREDTQHGGESAWCSGCVGAVVGAG